MIFPPITIQRDYILTVGYILQDSNYPEMVEKQGYSFTWTKYDAPITADITITGRYERVGSIDPPGPPIVAMSLLDGNSLGTEQPLSTGTLESTVVETRSYVYNGSKLVQETVTTETIEDNTTTTEVLYYAYDASGIPLSITLTDASGTENTYYYAVNIQGDVAAILTTSGTAVVEYTYDAWGNILSTDGTLSETLGETNSLRYRGYVCDNETGYYYLQSRYYNPELGRFINADGYISTGQGLLGYNMFAYCGNNSVVFVDPTGTMVCLDTQSLELSYGDISITTGDIASLAFIIEFFNLFNTNAAQKKGSEKKGNDKNNTPEPPDVKYPGDDPSVAPGDDYEWHGKQPVGGDKGAWVNENTGEQWHPDLNHKPPKGPHWDYTDADGIVWTVFPDGRILIW